MPLDPNWVYCMECRFCCDKNRGWGHNGDFCGKGHLLYSKHELMEKAKGLVKTGFMFYGPDSG